MKTIGYKVVSSNLESVLVDTDWKLKYEVGKEIFPVNPSAKIFAFTSLEDAERYCKFTSHRIFKAELSNPIKTMMLAVVHNNLSFAINLISSNRNRKDYAYPSAVTCDSVKLLEEIKV